MVNFRKFGPNKLINSPYCFGTMQFGGKSSEKDSAEMYFACREKNINFFDTAYIYNDGKSEEILGSLISKEREKIILISKAGAVGGLNAKNIRYQIEKSLKRLNQEYLDIFFLHKWDDNIDLIETFKELKKLKNENKFFHLGVSNFSAWQTIKSQSISEKIGGPEIEILQPMYNLIKRQVEVEIIPMSLKENFSIISYSPLGGGLLTGKYERKTNDDSRLNIDKKYFKRYSHKFMREATSKLVQFSKSKNLNPSILAISWVAKNPAITAPIISARNFKQLKTSLDSISFKISDDVYDFLNSLAPTPPPATDRLEEQL